MFWSWVQGMRSHQANHASDWREVLFGRLSLDYSRIHQGEKTQQAEQGLGFSPCTYYFVARSEPGFGDSSILFDAQRVDKADTTPFDSGGLWFDHIRTSVPLTTPEEHRRFVHEATGAARSRESEFGAWVHGNFGDRTDYVSGEPPKIGCSCDQVLVDPSNSRTWVWECRVERSDLMSSGLRPVQLVISKDRFDHYRQWVIGNLKISTRDKSHHLIWLADIYADPGTLAAGDFMNRKLVGGIRA